MPATELTIPKLGPIGPLLGLIDQYILALKIAVTVLAPSRASADIEMKADYLSVLLVDTFS